MAGNLLKGVIARMNTGFLQDPGCKTDGIEMSARKLADIIGVSFLAGVSCFVGYSLSQVLLTAFVKYMGP